MERYRIDESYDWNYAHAPSQTPEVDVPPVPGQWDFCGLPVESPLGMPAGPLLNGCWIAYYAALGFDALTYKTVRSSYRACYAPPNLLPVHAASLNANNGDVTEGPGSSWAISFGMPSKEPRVWREDIGWTRRRLKPRQVLAVSVVASPEPHWTLADMARDFAQLGRWAWDAGAQVVEANLSCPNVCSQEGMLYTSPESAQAIAAAMRAELGSRVPLALKIGLFSTGEQAEAVLEAVAPHVDAIATTNSITARVRDANGRPLFDDLPRGIGGECIRDGCQVELERIAGIVKRRGWNLKVIGVGGVSTASDVAARLGAGAHNVQLATAAMLDPLVAVRIRGAWESPTADTP